MPNVQMAERTHTPGSNFQGLLITNLVLTDVELGRGAYATVLEAEWNGTACAAKRLHDVLLEDKTAGGPDKLIRKFETECLTWSRLRHPGVVQFLGVYLQRSSRLPVLVMEKMDTSLRAHLEGHRREEFPLRLKGFVLRQVTQALAYLHSENPPLVHRDLSPNNVLLNEVSFATKLSDFGMTRAINPSAPNSRKLSIGGTQAFMPPEALHDNPQYSEKLDVFSFGNVIIFTLTHEWPIPSSPTKYVGDIFVPLTELQRRERYIEMFTAQEKQLFLPIVCQSLENRQGERPSSVMLVRDLKRIESSLTTGGHVFTSIKQLYQQLSGKEEECRRKDEVIREKEKVLREKDMALGDKDEVIRKKVNVIKGKEEELFHLVRIIDEKNAALREKDELIRRKDKALKDASNREQKVKKATGAALGDRLEDEPMREKEALFQLLQDEGGTDHGMGRQLLEAQMIKHAVRDWRKLGNCQRVIQHGFVRSYQAIAVSSEGLLVATSWRNERVHLLTKEGMLVRSIGNEVLGDFLLGVAFDLKGNILVADNGNHKVVKLSQDGRLLWTICATGDNFQADRFNNPCGVSVSPEGLIYICDSSNHRVSVHDEEGAFLFDFGSKRSGFWCFEKPRDIAFGSDDLVYVTDVEAKTVKVWTKEGIFKREFRPENPPFYIAATSDSHLLITSSSHTVMVYTLKGELVHKFGGIGSDAGRFNGPCGICVDDNGVVCVVDYENHRVQVF